MYMGIVRVAQIPPGRSHVSWLPILAYGIDYNRETTKNKAFYFQDKEALLEILSNLKAEELKSVADLMYEIAQGYYTWEKVVSSICATFIS